MEEAGLLAFEFPPCLDTCLLCPQPRTQLSQPRVTYPHMNGSAAFPTMVTLVAQAFVTVGSNGRCEPIPGVHSSVCHTQSQLLGSCLFPREVWRKWWRQTAGFCIHRTLVDGVRAYSRPATVGAGHLCVTFLMAGAKCLIKRNLRKGKPSFLGSQF